jgi:CheY-like chemotaxis protein
LVIDDDADIRDVVQLILEDAGYTVTVARDGAAALDVLRHAAPLPVLILLDLGMPLIDGRTLRRIQHGNPQWRTIPVVVVSALPAALHRQWREPVLVFATRWARAAAGRGGLIR